MDICGIDQINQACKYLLSPQALVVLLDLLVQEYQVIQCYPSLPEIQ